MKILLVDDHVMIIEALAQMVRKYFPRAQISTAADRAAALNFLAANEDCDALVSDLSFHGKMDGYALVKEVSSKYPEMGVIVLSMHDEHAFVRKALVEGARGYIVKTDPPEEICRAIESVVAGKTYLSSSLNAKKIGELEPSAQELSAREQEIAQLVKRGASSKVIGEKLSISPRTVEVHRRNLMRKLEVHNTAQLVALLNK